MLVYLSKKIAIPNDALLASLSWHQTQGYIACGGEDGLLKVLKLEVAPGKDAKMKGLAAPSNLSMNQSLDGHNGCVQVVAWNEVHNRLTSSDQNGLIIVWQLNKGLWVEEMINNRNKSVVRHMKWNPDGSKICIVYEDGAIIVGTVKGARIWGKELKGLSLTHVQWSPDSKVILFGHSKGEIQIYDSHGTFNAKLTILCLSNVTGLVRLVAVEWFCGNTGSSGQPNFPVLAIVYDNGRAQLMKHELDDNPILLDMPMSVSCMKWNRTGSLIAFGGSQRYQDGKEMSCMQFYSTIGQLLYTLRVPGRNLYALSWEGTGLRVAMAVGPHIYFANIRRDYKWGYFCDTVVYSFKKPDRAEDCIIFWNTSTGERNAKSVRHLIAISSCRDLCLLAARVDDTTTQCTLLLCDALGTPVDSRHIEMEPNFVSLSYTHAVAASSKGLFVWHYRPASSISRRPSQLSFITGNKSFDTHDVFLHIDSSSQTTDSPTTFKATLDPVSCICCSEQAMVVGRASGTLQVYSLPKLSLECRQATDYRPQHLALNSNSTKLSVIDGSGVLCIYELMRQGGEMKVGQRLPLERKEVWDLGWANDNPHLFAIMEKTRMYIFRGLDPEEPVVSSGHICRFEDMQVVSVLLDEIMKDPENPTEDLLFHLDIKSLRDTRNLLEKVGLQDAQQFIEDNPHPRLWKLLGESALEKLELEMAEKAFVKSKNYQGICFVKRLKKLDSEAKQRAEIQVYFKRFEEAEKLYIEMDRRVLAVDLRQKLGDWFRVVQLLKSGGGAGDDSLLTQAWNAIGDYYADRLKFRHATTYYSQGRNYEQLVECYYKLDDFAALKDLVSTLPPNSSLLENIANKFLTVGMAEEAVEAFLRANLVKRAIDSCVSLNQWALAVDLAKKHSANDVNALLAKYAAHLLETGRVLSAIELYRKANYFLDAAKLLIKVAKQARLDGLGPLKVKKIYALAALMVDSHVMQTRQRASKADLSSASNRRSEFRSTLQELLAENYSSVLDSSWLNNPWRAVEAYHFFLLVQKLFYGGFFEEALKTAIFLKDYEDLLSPVDLYSLLALTSSASRAFGICSKAFIKLESLEELPEDAKQAYEKVALEIFTKYPPKDSVEGHALQCPNCSTVINEWVSKCTNCENHFSLCTVTGQPIHDYQAWHCAVCKHPAQQQKIIEVPFNNCPFCHAHI